MNIKIGFLLIKVNNKFHINKSHKDNKFKTFHIFFKKTENFLNAWYHKRLIIITTILNNSIFNKNLVRLRIRLKCIKT